MKKQMKYSVLGVSLFYPAACLAETAQTFPKSLILVSGSDGLENLPIQILESYDAEYDVLRLTSEKKFTYPACSEPIDLDLCGTGINTTVDIDSLGLIDPTTNSPKYTSIIFTSTALGYSIYNSDYERDWVQSALSQPMWAELDEYCTSHDVRTVVLNSNPKDIGVSAIKLDLPENLSRIETDTYTLSFVESNLVSDIHLEDETVYWMPVEIDDNENLDKHIQPLLHIIYTCPDSDLKECQSVGAEVITDLSSRRETLHFHFTSEIDGLHHGFTLGNIWYPWVTRDLFLEFALPSATPTPNPSTAPSLTPSTTPSSSLTPSTTPTPTPSTTPSLTPSTTPSLNPSTTPSLNPSTTPTPTPTPTESALPSTTPTPTPTESALPSTTPTPTPTESALPSTTPTPTPTVSALPSTTPTPTPTGSASPTTTPTPTPTKSALPTNGSDAEDPKTPSPVESDSSSLSTGATIGIAIGAVVAVIVVALFAIWMMRRRRTKLSSGI
eukprot:CFRG1794T1